MRLEGHVTHMGYWCTLGFGAETWGKEPLGRLKCRWKDDIEN